MLMWKYEINAILVTILPYVGKSHTLHVLVIRFLEKILPLR